MRVFSRLGLVAFACSRSRARLAQDQASSKDASPRRRCARSRCAHHGRRHAAEHARAMMASIAWPAFALVTSWFA